MSRAVSHALRHEPWAYELELDEHGWVSVDALVRALRQHRWPRVTASDVEVMVATASKQRHEIDGGRIRALYGHSVPGHLHRVPARPPDLLFHGTAPQAVAVILREGLRPMQRQFVHLSVDRQTAVAVGSRKASVAVVLQVAAGAAARYGVRFYPGNDKVWLADDIPAEFVDRADRQAPPVADESARG